MCRALIGVVCAAVLSGCGAARGDDFASGFAVAELFTSEGCSSCPPADALLADIVRDAGVRARPVYALSFHVDYWDDIGWRDPWSSARHSARQRAYARAQSRTGVYTPQLVINGRDAFVGSNAGRARASLERALRGGPRLALALSANTESQHVQLRYQLGARAPDHAALQVALVQLEAESRVTRGENTGRMLHHANVVRSFDTIPLDDRTSGTLRIPRPTDISPRELGLIAYLQNLDTLDILAAGSAQLQP